MLDSLDLPFALFGHSMGAFIAFDLAHELSRLGRPRVHLFVSAQRGPGLPYPARPIFALPEDQFLAGVLARYDRIPRAVLQQKDLLALLLRMLRADCTLSEDYRYRAERPLACPITAFGGSHDAEVGTDQLELWSAETTDRLALYTMAGGHFFLQNNLVQLISVIRSEFQP